MLYSLRAAITWAGCASLGQYEVQMAQSWHAHIEEFDSARSFRPHWTQTISLRGNGFSGVEIGQTIEQVPHW